MSGLNINNSREFAHLVDHLDNGTNKIVKEPYTDLVSALNRSLAKGWSQGQASLHVHVRFRLIGETITSELCCLFQRKWQLTEAFLQQDSRWVPSNGLSDVLDRGKAQLNKQGLVLIHVGESFDYCEQNGNAVVWLRTLNDCPRIPIDCYPIKNTELWLALSELDFIEEPFLAFTNRKLISPTWFMSVSKDKLPYKVVKGRTEIVNNISNYDREANIWDNSERGSHYNIPRAITPYIELTNIGLMFAPDINLRFQDAIMFFGPPELGSNPSKVGNPRSHGSIIHLYTYANTLSDRRYLTIEDIMQSLCLNNNERDKTMNSYFANTANSDVIQPPISLEISSDKV